MSSATAKKPPPPSREGASTPTGSPSRTPARASTPSGGAPSTVTRARSVRSGTPVSARAAAARRESPLNPASNASSEADEAARAETVALLDDLKDRLAKAESASELYQKQAGVLQSRLDESQQEHAKLEEKVHEIEEHMEGLQNEKREGARQMQQMETIYEAERSAMAKEKDQMATREEEMQAVIQRLKDTLAQRAVNGDDEGRPTRQCGFPPACAVGRMWLTLPAASNHSPSLDGGGGFAPPASLQRSDSRNNSKLLLQKDKLIESLRLELAEAQIKLVETENQGGGRLHEVERLLMEARMANARLMEDNESYQLLLQEKTLKGDFGTSDFGYLGGMATNQDALNALEGRSGEGGAGGGSSLADELSEAAENESDNYRRLEAELKTAKDQNKALTLYINKIIERLLQHQDFEHILDQSSEAKPNTNKELPPPPQGAAQSLLQRAKSIAIGAAGPAKPRPRPMSFVPTAMPTAHNNPETAPSIPIGLPRSSSVRRPGRPMSEQFTGGTAAVVHALYKGGASSGSELSPPLRGSQAFPFGAAHGGGSHSAPRTPSGSAVPLSTSGNFPGMKSETSSTSGESTADRGDLTTPPSQSPPRAGAHHERAAFTGTKPRPLRLVQENPESVKAENKRASWMGWAFGGKKEEATLTGGDTIKE